MAHIVQLKRSATTTAAPTAGQLSAGELAINTVDETIFFKNSSGTVKKLSAMSDLTSNMVLLTGNQTIAGVKTFSSSITCTGTAINTTASGTFAIAGPGTLNLATDATSVTIGSAANGTVDVGAAQFVKVSTKIENSLYLTLQANVSGIASTGSLGVGSNAGPTTLGDWEGGGNGSTIEINDSNQLITCNRPVTISSTTASTSSTTGAVIIAGGVGIAKDSYINGHKIGRGAGNSDTNIAVGRLAMDNNTGTSVTAVGVQAADQNTGTTVLAFGYQAGYYNYAANLVAIGSGAGLANTGVQSIFVGSSAGNSNSGSNAVGIGFNSLFTNTGNNACCIGASAGAANTGDVFVAIGSNAGYGNSGYGCVAIGTYALSLSCSGHRNTAIGSNCMDDATTAANNTSAGSHSLGGLTTGASNTALGGYAGDTLTTGSNNVIIGFEADFAAASNDNSIVIGKGATGLGSNTTVIGTSSTTETKLFGQLTLDATACISAASATNLALKTVVPAGTGVTPTVQIICPSAAYTLTNGTGAQAVFNTPIDTITLQALTTYMVEGQYLLQTGTTSHTTSISFASAGAFTSPDFSYTTIASTHSSANATARTQDTSFFTSISGGIVSQASVLPNTIILFKGILRTTYAGTLVPQLTFSVAPGSTNFTLVGSYIKFYPIGANTIDKIGSAIG